MRVSKIFFISIIICLELNAQQLKPFIGLNQAPQSSDPICPIQNYLGNFDDSGYHIGDTVNDFTLYNKDNLALSLSETLKKGKPVLLISSSYTCWVFRDNIAAINQLYSEYKDQLEIFVIYTVEAHPDKDISPYFGRVNTGANNIKDGILYRQPVLYGDRLQIIEDLLIQQTLDVPLFIDGPCNEWWYHFGPAPNNATLIDPNGVVQIKHAWFDRDPNDIFCDVKKYLDPTSFCDSIPAGNSRFEFTMISDTLVQAEVNSVVYAIGSIKNISTVPVKIEVRRLKNNLPANWFSSICLDVCYPTTVDSTMITLKPDQKMDMIIDFFTGPVPGQGSVQIGMRNVDHTQNKFFMNATAVSTDLTNTSRKEKYQPDVLIYPQPSTSFLRIKTTSYNQYILFDEKGVVYQKGWIDESETIERKNIASGLYLLKLSNDDGKFLYKKVIFN